MTNGGSVSMGGLPFFYVKNNNFVAMFKIEEGKPIAIVNPSKALAKII